MKHLQLNDPLGPCEGRYGVVGSYHLEIGAVFFCRFYEEFLDRFNPLLVQSFSTSVQMRSVHYKVPS